MSEKNKTYRNKRAYIHIHTYMFAIIMKDFKISFLNTNKSNIMDKYSAIEP